MRKAMVIQPGPGFSVLDVGNGVCKGLAANGFQVGNFNLHDRLTFYTSAHLKPDNGRRWRRAFPHEEALKLAVRGAYAHLYEFVPEIVVIISGFYTPPNFYNLLRARGHKIVLWCTESPYEDSRQIPQAALADACIINDPTNLPAFRQVQPNTYYIGHSYDPDIHRPLDVDPAKASDFFWVGTAYPSRMEFFEAVDWRDLNVRLGGNWELVDDDSPLARKIISDQPNQCLDNHEAVAWYSSSRSSVNVYRREFGDGFERRDAAAGWAMGPREVEMAAIGCFYLTEERGENREVLPMVPTFDGPGDFTEQLHWWLDHDVERLEVVAKAQAAIADLTFESNVARMLQLLDH